MRVSLGNLNSVAFLCALTSLLACSENSNKSYLFVSAIEAGQYEVYKIESESPLQYTSELIGNYNEALAIEPGHYLILADCSSQDVIVNPNKTVRLIAHTMTFNPPIAPLEQDLFSIQCERFSGTQARQNLNGKFKLNVLSGNRDFLVGMVPYSIDPSIARNTGAPESITQNLSAITISKYENMQPGTRFFVSPKNEIISITQNQEFGKNLFLLPGEYLVEVNGTAIEVSLKPLESKSISPAFVSMGTPDVDLTLSPKIKGIPAFAEINAVHHIELNSRYPVLPGEVELSLSDSKEVYKVLLEQGQETVVKARSLVVKGKCSPWDWTCIGTSTVYVYESETPYPIAQGVTDVPILFFSNNAWVSLQGSMDVHVKVPPSDGLITLDTGVLVTRPEPVFRNSVYTDLARIEGRSDNVIGQSLDLNLSESEQFLLVAGQYRINTFISSSNHEVERRGQSIEFTIHQNSSTEVPFVTYTRVHKGEQKYSDANKSKPHLRPSNKISVNQIIPSKIY